MPQRFHVLFSTWPPCGPASRCYSDDNHCWLPPFDWLWTQHRHFGLGNSRSKFATMHIKLTAVRHCHQQDVQLTAQLTAPRLSNTSDLDTTRPRFNSWKTVLLQELCTLTLTPLNDHYTIVLLVRSKLWLDLKCWLELITMLFKERLPLIHLAV